MWEMELSLAIGHRGVSRGRLNRFYLGSPYDFGERPTSDEFPSKRYWPRLLTTKCGEFDFRRLHASLEAIIEVCWRKESKT